MRGRTVAAAVGSGITAFPVVAVAVIELRTVEFSALVGLPVGFVAGATTAVLVATRYQGLARSERAAVDAGAGFGVVVVTALAVSYVNLAGLRSALSVSVVAGAGILGAALAALASYRTGTEPA